jgi:nifR3 family TIM-barrel protein
LYHPLLIKNLRLKGNLFLAPVAGYTDRAFRAVCVDAGADFSFTELASSEALVRGGEKTLDLLRRGENERAYAIQLFGSDPENMYRAALLLGPFRPDALDLNCGCPVPKVCKTGAGAALMRKPLLLGHLVGALVRASAEGLGDVPVTVKLRSGWDAGALNYAECARIAFEEGASLVTLHPRTRAQAYAGKSDWGHIADLVSRLPLPVAGSGDLFSPEDSERMLRETRCAAVMFARGAMGNPFIFAQARSLLTTGQWTPPPWEARFATAFRQLRLLAADMGEERACREMRKQFCAYTKAYPGEPGLPGSASLRRRIVQAGTIADYQEILGGLGINC